MHRHIVAALVMFIVVVLVTMHSYLTYNMKATQLRPAVAKRLVRETGASQ